MEAAVKSADEQEELNAEFFEDVSTKITIPRRAKMKDQVTGSRTQNQEANPNWE